MITGMSLMNEVPMSGYFAHGHIDFVRINSVALSNAETILSRWLPNGRSQGHEYVARNPKRVDRRLGSFKINMTTGRWADFATGDAGGDFISLAAYLFELSQTEAALRLANMVGVDPGTDR